MIQQEFLTRLELSKYIIVDMTQADRINLLDKYDKLAASILNKTGTTEFNNDIVNFRTVLNNQVFSLFIRNVPISNLQEYTNLYNLYRICKNATTKQLAGQSDSVITDKTYIRMYKELSSKISELGTFENNSLLDTNSVQVAIQTFGLDTSTPDETIIQEPEILEPVEPEVKDELYDLFDDDELLENYGKYIDTEEEGDDNNEEEEDGNNKDESGDTYVFEDEQEEDNDQPSEEDNSIPTEDEEGNEQPSEEESEVDDTMPDEDAPLEEKSDLYKKLERELGQYLKGSVNTICNVLGSLYSSGFTRAQAGVLIDRAEASSPLVAIRKIDTANDISNLQNMGIDITDSDRNRGYKTVSISDDGTFQDRLIYKAIVDAVPQLGVYADNPSGGSIPDVNTLIQQDAVCYKLHLQFQSANIDYCTKENSEIKIKDWVKETQLEKNGVKTFTEWRQKINDNKRRLKSYKSMVRPWYEWSVKKILIQSLIDAGITDSTDIPAIQNIVNRVTSNLRNVVVMSVRSPGAEYEVKISSSNTSTGQREQMRDSLLNRLTGQLNLAGSSDIEIKQIASEIFDSTGVLTLSIVMDKKKANANTIFAGDIINELKNEEKPSWAHALLGMTEDRQWLYWDGFMDPKKAGPSDRCYTIYAASRAGKGNMTAALLANALCDGKRVFYTDGKPETGTCLGELAWLAGVEAYVFDGQRVGSKPFSGYMEDWTNGLRSQSDVTQFIKKLPSELFENGRYFSSNTQEIFLGVMRYLKSLSLCTAIMGGKAKGTLPNDNWDIWIFDEMTKMSNLESQIRSIFVEYLGDKGVKGVKKGDTTNYKAVLAGVDYTKIDSEMTEQGNEKYDAGVAYILNWLKWTDSIVSAIVDAAVISLGKSNSNIIFIFQNASWLQLEGDLTTIGKVVTKLDSTKIVGNGGLADTCKKYGEAPTQKKAWYANTVNTGRGWWAISKGTDIRTADVDVFKPFSVWTVPIDGSDNRTSKPGEDKDHRYLYGYILELCEAFGISPSSILNQAYTFAGEAVKTLGFAETLEEYMYNAFSLLSDEASAQYDKLLAERAANSDGSSDGIHAQPTVTSQVNMLDDPEQGAPLDFGYSDPMPQQSVKPNEPSPIPGQRQNSLGEQQKTLAENALDQVRQDEQDIKNLSFLTTAQLRKKNYSDNVLQTYIVKILNRRQRLETNNFNYTDRDPRSPGGLRAAAIVFSSLCYMKQERGITNLDNIVVSAQSCIQQLMDRQDKYKFMLGMIDDYLNSRLDYDELPDENRLREYQQKFAIDIAPDTGHSYNDNSQQPEYNAGQPEYNNTGYQEDEYTGYDEQFNDNSFDRPEGTQGSNESILDRIIREKQNIEYDPSDIDNTFQYGNGPVINIKPTETSDTVRISMDDYLEVSAPKWHTIERFKKKLFESSNGIAYEFKKRWDYVLKKIAEGHPDRALVRKLVFTELHIVVNNKTLALNDIIGGEDDILVTDILRIRDTFKKFPMVQQLTLDGPTTQCLIDEYGTTAQEVWSIFQENKSLKTLVFTIPGTTQQMTCRRETFANTVDQFNKAMGIKIGLMQQEQFISNYNPRMEEKSPGYVNRVLKNKKSKASSWFSKQPKTSTKMSPVARKRMKFAVGTLGILGLGAIIGVPGLLATGIAGGIGYLKGGK